MICCTPRADPFCNSCRQTPTKKSNTIITRSLHIQCQDHASDEVETQVVTLTLCSVFSQAIAVVCITKIIQRDCQKDIANSKTQDQPIPLPLSNQNPRMARENTSSSAYSPPQFNAPNFFNVQNRINIEKEEEEITTLQNNMFDYIIAKHLVH